MSNIDILIKELESLKDSFLENPTEKNAEIFYSILVDNFDIWQNVEQKYLDEIKYISDIVSKKTFPQCKLLSGYVTPERPTTKHNGNAPLRASKRLF